MTSGEISCEFVVCVMVEVVFDVCVEGKVYEIVESGFFVGGDFVGVKMFVFDFDSASWFV